MVNEIKKTCVELTSQIMHAYYCRRDIDEVLSFLADDVQWIGPGEMDMKFSFEEISEYFQLGKDRIPVCDISSEEYHTADYGDTCMVTGLLNVRSGEASKMIIETNQRISFLFGLIEGKLKVRYMHLSNPYAEMLGEEFFPRTLGTQSYDYLQRMLQEKTEVIEMISANINGGLKGSNDDETFSYFYVNQGLPEMLGYTYEEFMEKSCGHAVGAVYPPDLSAALQSVAEWFAKGPLYSAEYRMEKKDGSLIWVMDSGKKMMDSQGICRINSIITDITPLKSALFELEVERERYRIALENITDVMCEYDIEQDLYVTYQRIEVEGKTELEKFEIPQFSKYIWNEVLVCQEDAKKLLDVLKGDQREEPEIRIRNMQSGDQWRWSQVRCSVIYDSNHKPVRTIGTMKDITEEKEKQDLLILKAERDSLTGLLNQVEMKNAVKAHLLAAGEWESSAILVLDIDDFKLVNDTYGHLFGDKVLIGLADVLRSNIRRGDEAGRIGGDEFLILLKSADQEKAVRCAQRIIQEVASICGDGQAEISCSIGISITDENTKEFDQLFHSADQALYEAKRMGKKRVFCSGK